MDTLKRNDDGSTTMIFAQRADKSEKVINISCSNSSRLTVKFVNGEYLQRVFDGWLVIQGFDDIRLEPCP